MRLRVLLLAAVVLSAGCARPRVSLGYHEGGTADCVSTTDGLRCVYNPGPRHDEPATSANPREALYVGLAMGALFVYLVCVTTDVLGC